jgi:hypothetical protein
MIYKSLNGLESVTEFFASGHFSAESATKWEFLSPEKASTEVAGWRLTNNYNGSTILIVLTG